ncbi:hypothetical protein BpHYR1_054366 [Brachionus plicatilis]|uniref:Uncharacterized protein n=1 Tax=Brachionus plicatilis TaxID=10195 RepID=A0A3M7RE67_BRAPC|nr:hypothetical protein BpHYR1_054366 [Brachionus plicatilis]
MYLRTFSDEKTLISTSCWVHAIGWRGLARHGRRGMKTLPNWTLRMFAILTPSVWKLLNVGVEPLGIGALAGTMHLVGDGHAGGGSVGLY